MVAHSIDVSRTSNIGLGHHRRAQSKGAHSEDIWFDNPVICIDKCHMEPIREFSWLDIKEVGYVAQHHQSWNVVGPTFLHHRGNGFIQTSQSTLLAPVGLG